MKISIFTKIKFLKWLWIDLALTILICITYYLLIYLFKLNNYTFLYYIPHIFLFPFTIYYIIKVARGQKRRIYEYKRLYSIFDKNKSHIKKSILYEMRYTKCEQPIVSQLCKDFSIKL